MIASPFILKLHIASTFYILHSIEGDICIKFCLQNILNFFQNCSNESFILLKRGWNDFRPYLHRYWQGIFIFSLNWTSLKQPNQGTWKYFHSHCILRIFDMSNCQRITSIVMAKKQIYVTGWNRVINVFSDFKGEEEIKKVGRNVSPLMLFFRFCIINNINDSFYINFAFS